MYSLHFSGSPWFLLLLLPGFLLLGRQYHSAGQAGREARPGRILLGLQSLALLLLVAQLVGPEIRRHQVEFHNPSVLLLRDRSGSFRNGAYLGLGAAHARMQASLASLYGSRRFKVFIADFDETAWPVSGFPRPGRGGTDQARGQDNPGALTGLGALAEFVDSTDIPNLQAAFLFSDGRGNLDSGRAYGNWRVPLYPVVFPVDSLAEVQAERVEFAYLPGRAPAGELRVTWRPVGTMQGAPVLRILKPGRPAQTLELPLPEGGLPGRDDAIVSRLPFTLDPGKVATAPAAGLRAVVAPAKSEANVDPFNDTLPLGVSAGRGARHIVVLKPVRSLDEKGMLDILHAWEETGASAQSREELAKGPLTDKDQVWVEASAFSASSVAAALKDIPAKVVVYARADGNPPDLRINGATVPWREFSPAGEVRVAKGAEEFFPDEVVRLKSLSDDPMFLPAAGAPWKEVAGVGEAGKRGLLMARFPLGPGKQAFFFVLPPIWTQLFDPQGDFAVRENIAGYIRAIAGLADRESSQLQVSRPQRVYHQVPFAMEFRLPADRGAGAAGAAPATSPELRIAGPGFSREFALSPPGPGGSGERGEYRLEVPALEAGAYRLELRFRGEAVWSDSLRVEPREALELARIGFDRASLEQLASLSGGRVLESLAGEAGDTAQVAAWLPKASSAQIRTELTRDFPLYNTRWLFLAVFALLAAAWTLRKKWDFD